MEIENIIRISAIIIPNLVLGFVLIKIRSPALYNHQNLLKDMQIMQKLPENSLNRKIVEDYIERKTKGTTIQNKKKFLQGFFLFNVGFYLAVEGALLKFQFLSPIFLTAWVYGMYLMYRSLFENIDSPDLEDIDINAFR